MSIESYTHHALSKILNREDMSFEEAEKSMDEIMQGKVSPVIFSSWLTALRMKGEKPDEIAGCASSMRKHVRPIYCEDKHAVDIVGTGGDKSLSINISTAASFVAAGAGVTIAKHGNRAVSSKAGSADVFEALGININMCPEKMEACLKEVGMAFLYAPSLHTAMGNAMPVRKELAIRTIFNILGPMTNPAFVKHYVIGVYQKDLCGLMASAGLKLGFEHSMFVHGHDGLDEITITGPTHICEIKNGRIDEYDLSLSEIGIEAAGRESLQGSSPQENAFVIKRILDGSIDGAKARIIMLNAAAAILVSGKSHDWKHAYEKAKESISSGNALGKLEAMIKFSSKP